MNLLGWNPTPPLPRPQEPPYDLEEVALGRGGVTHYVVALKPHALEQLRDVIWSTVGYHLDDELPLCGMLGEQRAPLPRARPCKSCETYLDSLERDLDGARWRIAERLAWPEIEAALREAVRARAGEVGF